MFWKKVAHDPPAVKLTPAEVYRRIRERYYSKPVHQRPPRTRQGLAWLLTPEEGAVLVQARRAYPPPTAILNRTPSELAKEAARAEVQLVHKDLEQLSAAVGAQDRRMEKLEAEVAEVPALLVSAVSDAREGVLK